MSDSTNTSYITIPLPPGYTEQLYWELQVGQLRVSIVTAVAFAVIVWDYILLLPDEISLYKTKGIWTRKNVAPYAFVAIRYGGILATLPSLFFTSIPSQHCHFGTSISQVGAVIVSAASGLIFCIRLSAIWEFNKIIMGIIGFLYTGMVVCWITVATQMAAITGPATPLFSNCVIDPIHSWNAVSFTSSVVFDCAVLFLTILKLRNPNSTLSRSKLAGLLVRDGIFYFVGAAVVNITVLSIEGLNGGLNIELLKPLALPFSTLFTSVLGSRVFLNLGVQERRKKRMMSIHRGEMTTGAPMQIVAAGDNEGKFKGEPHPMEVNLPEENYHPEEVWDNRIPLQPVRYRSQHM